MTEKIPSEAAAAYEAALRQYGAAELRVHRTEKATAPRPVEWCVIAKGQVVAASQAHLVGRKRSA